ncbi:S9 family peptidase [Olivibacter sp. XZL3]|uniref:S9 family peptidase n=1 Tax=Olivibacter sp. XZL3 TaxID=1735116 RepID=UPI001F1004AA|nr:S9 family peptidase [Olivibacter sp. XZL3]
MLFITFFSSVLVKAQAPLPFNPSHAEIVDRYKRAMKLDSLTKNIVFKSTVEAHWLNKGTSFWYRNVLQDSTTEYVYVDAITGRKRPLLDKKRVAAALRKIDVKADEQRLWVSDIMLPEKNEIHLEIEGKWFAFLPRENRCFPINAKVKTTDQTAPGRRANRRSHGFRYSKQSPDKKWEAYIEHGNLFAKPLDGGQPIQFTYNGSDSVPYGAIQWSPDSKYLAGYHIHPVKDSSVYVILTSVPGTTRGVLSAQPYKQPGDPFTSYDLFVFSIDQKKASQVKTERIDFPNRPPELHWRHDDPNFFFYEKFDRGHQRFRVMEVDARTGQAKPIVDEKSDTFIYLDRQYTYYPEGTNWLIRSSEKDGWRHLYLVDLVSGAEKQITKGNWVVRGVDSVDVNKKEVWFSASGMEAGEDPYFVHHYRMSFDGENLRKLSPERANHEVTFSPDKRFYIDTYSTLNTAPVTKLRRSSDGKELAVLEEADVLQYEKIGLRQPEVFVAKGRDGKTDIWGMVSRPSDLDSTKKYPILENIYAGPHDSFVPKSFVPYSEMQSLAELGFIVVMIDGMGTANRSKAFHDVCWQNIADAGLEDRILWMKALAEKYPQADTSRVGIYGTSAGGQNTVSALLFHSTFYKAGVAACGCHDNRVDKQWWNEQWMGYPIGKHYAAQSNVTNAHKLQGDLLLIVGENDTNVPPESSYRVADALIKAGKDFDFLAVPGMGHSDGGAYGRMKKRDFFVKHLLNVEPPRWNAGELSFKNEMGRERWSFQ